MKLKLHSLRARHIFYAFLHKGLYPFMAFIFMCICAFQMYMVYLTQQDLSREQDSLDALHLRLKKFSQNARITEEDRVVYGTILKRQIPTHNNTFDTFALIDSFYQVTGIELKTSSGQQTSSSQRPSKSTQAPASVSFTATATLTPESLQVLLDRYQYEFPRYLTLSAIQLNRSVTAAEQGLYDVRLTFEAYTVPITKETSSADMSTNFTAADVAHFEAFKQRANTNLYYELQDVEPVSEDEYESAETIF